MPSSLSPHTCVYIHVHAFPYTHPQFPLCFVHLDVSSPIFNYLWFSWFFFLIALIIFIFVILYSHLCPFLMPLKMLYSWKENLLIHFYVSLITWHCTCTGEVLRLALFFVIPNSSLSYLRSNNTDGQAQMGAQTC